MRVASIKIHNILGIDDFEILPKTINRFEGKNAAGKTSVLEAIKGALKGGHDATLLRNGAEEGQIVILLDDGMEIKKTVTAEKSDLSVKYPRSGVKVDRPQTELNRLVDALSINPVEFLSAPAKDRAKYLLEAMPLKVTAEDLKPIWRTPTQLALDEHAFSVLAALEKLIFDERTGVNRLADEKKKTAKQLSETLPLEEPGKERPDWPAVVKQSSGDLAVAKAELETLESSAKSDLAADLKGVETDFNARFGALADEHRKKAEELERWRKDEYAKIDSEHQAARQAAKDKNEGLVAQKRPALVSSISALSSTLADAEANAKRQVKDDATRQTIVRVEAEADAHEQEAATLTARLEALNALRLRILENLPIPGVTVHDGQVMKNGVQYDRLNTAEQISIAIAIAKLRAKDLGIVCVDGLECLDQENFAEFERQMAETTLQTFITRVTNPECVNMEVITK